MSGRPALVTGGAGFIGCNLVDRLAAAGQDVIVYDALLRPGVERNLAWLQQRHPERIIPVIADVRDQAALTDAAMQAGVVFHLAAQVAVTTSMLQPLDDFDVNTRATIRLLDVLRRRNDGTPLIFASTNKVYGNLADLVLRRSGDAWQPADDEIASLGIDERRPLDFHTPYGCSKGAADQYVLDYAHSFDVPTCVFRMSCIYGPRQMGTEDQGWVAHFIKRALAGEPIRIYGDGCQVRDVLDVSDAVEAYLAAWQKIGSVSGRAFNLGGGPRNAISLRQLIDHIETVIDARVDLAFDDWRAGDQRWFVADARAARQALDLAEPLDWRPGVAALTSWLDGAQRAARAPAEAVP